MYAVISTGGKQYRVSKGDTIRIEKLDKKEGDKVLFDKVLLISDKGKVSIGKPFLEKGKIEGVVKAQGRDEKISIIKFNRRKHFKKQAGHRQSFTNVEITKKSFFRNLNIFGEATKKPPFIHPFCNCGFSSNLVTRLFSISTSPNLAGGWTAVIVDSFFEFL